MGPSISGVIMSKQPAGKTLLRNVIRHTDAHNKIQEEMEMWKMRGWEMQMSHPKQLPFKDNVRGHMHCDRVPDHPRDVSRSQERASQHDDREARYWTRKLYEFEAGDPDRWGHSGFKELYPEEFESDGEKSVSMKKACKRKKSKSDTKKSSRKRKKKKKKKAEDRKKRAESSSSGGSSNESSDTKDKPRKRKRTKSRHKNKKSRRRDEDSSSGDSNEEKSKRRTRAFRKRKRLSESDSGPDFEKKKRKDWKAGDGESSDDSSAD
uniref:Zgc:162339 n=1 Tax=Oryzias latipes TaxID=8090 RepID=A0A3P9LZP4_ORYLA